MIMDNIRKLYLSLCIKKHTYLQIQAIINAKAGRILHMAVANVAVVYLVPE